MRFLLFFYYFLVFYFYYYYVIFIEIIFAQFKCIYLRRSALIIPDFLILKVYICLILIKINLSLLVCILHNNVKYTVLLINANIFHMRFKFF